MQFLNSFDQLLPLSFKKLELWILFAQFFPKDDFGKQDSSNLFSDIAYLQIVVNDVL